ncbi:hypothetical protein MNEG_16739 [Monoraphidium neglectum]|uniref:Vta1 C-terminal domain-containing protein n=1 Tax=Monoraphidium neglectum TaxID=145388 RepID=A0A0D2LMG4_9CHLO|nr:hypothetical protein MNEG_16739 [Monoraphidium neglectum]KIY91226.1 hypothetical protein MNEG_16739 [Monoraphidium neglectum]|eukprot:XP_013890246.1 hypothetical protein MNEG_16739 [Monoraphidium neglectum]
MVVSAAGPDPTYRVAFRDRLGEVHDSALAPDAPPGSRVAFVEAAGAAGVGATVLAADAGAWPPSFLLRCDNGRDVPASYGQITLAIDVDPDPYQQQQPQQPSPQQQQPPPPPLPQQQQQSPTSSHHARHQNPLASAAAVVAAAVRAGAPPQPPPPPALAPAAAAQLPAPVPGYQPPLQAIQDAQKAAKYAVSSLSFDDISGAVKYLSEALRLLTQPGAARS